MVASLELGLGPQGRISRLFGRLCEWRIIFLINISLYN